MNQDGKHVKWKAAISCKCAFICPRSADAVVRVKMHQKLCMYHCTLERWITKVNNKGPKFSNRHKWKERIMKVKRTELIYCFCYVLWWSHLIMLHRSIQKLSEKQVKQQCSIAAFWFTCEQRCPLDSFFLFLFPQRSVRSAVSPSGWLIPVTG